MTLPRPFEPVRAGRRTQNQDDCTKFRGFILFFSAFSVRYICADVLVWFILGSTLYILDIHVCVYVWHMHVCIVCIVWMYVSVMSLVQGQQDPHSTPRIVRLAWIFTL